jgi:hypothetical protein
MRLTATKRQLDAALLVAQSGLTDASFDPALEVVTRALPGLLDTLFSNSCPGLYSPCLIPRGVCSRGTIFFLCMASLVFGSFFVWSPGCVNPTPVLPHFILCVTVGGGVGRQGIINQRRTNIMALDKRKDWRGSQSLHTMSWACQGPRRLLQLSPLPRPRGQLKALFACKTPQTTIDG